jgi:hypothetical protein
MIKLFYIQNCIRSDFNPTQSPLIQMQPNKASFGRIPGREFLVAIRCACADRSCAGGCVWRERGASRRKRPSRSAEHVASALRCLSIYLNVF